jgi:glyoxylase-like metal-dependent hydrolase (beta-lactamase superfamily II)
MHEADARREQEFSGPQAFQRADSAWITRRGGQAGDLASIRQPRPEMFEQFHVLPDRFLADGDRPLGTGSALSAIWTPGHTPGHVCFFDSGRNLMLTGDHILPRITPNISPAPGVEDDVLGEYLSSLLLLADYADAEVLPAHEYRFTGTRPADPRPAPAPRRPPQRGHWHHPRRARRRHRRRRRRPALESALVTNARHAAPLRNRRGLRPSSAPRTHWPYRQQGHGGGQVVPGR